jgi:hypothetical protein
MLGTSVRRFAPTFVSGAGDCDVVATVLGPGDGELGVGVGHGQVTTAGHGVVVDWQGDAPGPGLKLGLGDDLGEDVGDDGTGDGGLGDGGVRDGGAVGGGLELTAMISAWRSAGDQDTVAPIVSKSGLTGSKTEP